MASNPLKRKANDSAKDVTELFQTDRKRRHEHSSLVADHYNKRGNTSCADRMTSKIYYMRNFNNWTKSVLIKKYLDKLKESGLKERPVVLDLGCGKGGDLLKWDKGKIKKIVCTDIATTSIDQCKERYQNLVRKSRRGHVFDAEFIVNDSGKESLQDKMQTSNQTFDMTSCQFVIHYTFESENQAEMMVKNACCNLKEGGFFIGSTVNSEKLIETVTLSDKASFGNDVFKISFDTISEFPEFGSKYTFKLHDVVDCPEFLLKKETLVRICAKYGMRLVEWETFADFFQQNCESKESFQLIRRMKALEVYPPRNNETLNSSVTMDYDHAKDRIDSIVKKYPNASPRVATLSKTEWDAASIYVVYAFVKDTEKKALDDIQQNKKSQKEKIPLVLLY